MRPIDADALAREVKNRVAYSTDYENGLALLSKKHVVDAIKSAPTISMGEALMEIAPQELDKLNNPLEPIKVAAALRSEIVKHDYRKGHDPKSISPLDYTIMAALIRILKEARK